MDPQRYAELFRSESREQLSEINRALLDLEGTPGELASVHVLFRAVHTLKGMSATMGYAGVAAFAHEMESLLDRVRTGTQGITAELMDVLFAAADVLEAGVERAVNGEGDPPALSSVLTQMRHVAGGGATAEFRAVTGEYSANIGEFESDASAVADADLRAPSLDDGPGVLVRVRQRAETLLPGVRAFMVIQKARTLGDVVAMSPLLPELQAAETPQAFAFRLVTPKSASEIESAILATGDIEHVEVSAGPGRHRGSVQMATMAPAASAPKGTRHVRIELARLDTLMNLIGELVITRGRLMQLTAGRGDAALDEAMTQTSRLIGDLQAEVMASRMVPVWQVFDRFPRLVRDAARQLQKEIEFSVEGKDIELDRSLLDEIGEPVVHLLRNAVDHGIEAPGVRVSHGKPRAGRLVLSASRERSAVLVRVQDDGRGIDRERVLARAKELGMVGPDVARLDAEQLFRVIASPGFSTAAAVSNLSGRGVGIDAVQARVRQLGGAVELETVPGRGTTITLRLPQTLAIVRAVLARVGAERYALPLHHVRETLAWSAEAVQTVQGREVLVLRDEVLPLVRLREVVRAPGEAHDATADIVVLERGDRRAGLVVDELTDQQDIVVKQFDAVRDGLALFSGATILADGRAALIVDVASLL